MSKQTLTVELEVPEGYELTGEYRPPRSGDDRVLCGGKAIDASGYNAEYPILRKAWQPPKWLPDGCWVYAAWDGEWCVCMCEPENFNGGFAKGKGASVPTRAAVLAAFFGETFTPPPVKKIQVKH